MTLEVRIEQVEVAAVGEPRPDGLKMIVLGVTSSVDPDRVGATFTVPTATSFKVTPGYVGTAFWMPGEQLPKLLLFPGKTP